jgi:hypothetical protein
MDKTPAMSDMLSSKGSSAKSSSTWKQRNVEVIALDFAVRAFFVLGCIVATVAFSKALAQEGLYECFAGICPIISFSISLWNNTRISRSPSRTCVKARTQMWLANIYKILDSFAKRAETYPNNRM